MHKPWGAFSYYLEQSSWSYHNIYLSFGIFLGSFGCLLHLLKPLNYVIFLQSLILVIVWFPPSIRHWIRAFDFTHIMRNAQLIEELSLYWPYNFFTYFGNWCQWGRSLEGLREFGLCLCFVLKHFPFMHCIVLVCIVEYLEETPLGFECQYMQWNSSSFTRAYIMGEFALCIQLVWYLNSLY